MSRTYRIGMLGFSAFERDTLAACFRLSGDRRYRYERAAPPAEGDFMLVDADHAVAAQTVADGPQGRRSVFIGASPPAGALAWLARPIDPVQVLRELDALVAAQAAVAAAAAPAALAPSQDAPPGRPVEAPPPPRALLVDDSAIARHFLASRLHPFGMHTEQADTSAQALARLAVQAFDFAFIDVELGADSDLDGLALCQHIKHHPGAWPAVGPWVFMVSAHHDEIDRVRGTLAGCDGYLGKPLQEAELRRLLMRHGLRQQALRPAS